MVGQNTAKVNLIIIKNENRARGDLDTRDNIFGRKDLNGAIHGDRFAMTAAYPVASPLGTRCKKNMAYAKFCHIIGVQRTL